MQVKANGFGTAWLTLLILFLISPPFVYRLILGSNGRILDTALLWSMGMSVLLVATLHTLFGAQSGFIYCLPRSTSR